jgi:glycogen operon protein
MLLDGRAQESGIKRRGSDATLLLIFNAHFDVVQFRLPDVADGRDWLALVDTNQPDGQPASFPFGHDYAVTGRSLVALALSAGGSATRRLLHGTESILEVVGTPLPPCSVPKRGAGAARAEITPDQSAPDLIRSRSSSV